MREKQLQATQESLAAARKMFKESARAIPVIPISPEINSDRDHDPSNLESDVDEEAEIESDSMDQ